MKRIVTNEEIVCDICGQLCTPGNRRLMLLDGEQYVVTIDHVPSCKYIKDICPECFDKILRGY